MEATNLVLVDGVWTRPGTLDEWIVKEHRNSPYLRYRPLKSSDVWIDVGANIGVFASQIAPSVNRVICYEPEPANFQLLEKNVRNFLNVERFQFAVAREYGDRELFLNQKKNQGAHSFYVKSGRGEPITVKTIGINDVLKAWNPTCLKLDCEGAEIEIVPAVEDWGVVEYVVLEYHFSALRDKNREGLHRVVKKLEKAFETVLVRGNTEKAWTGYVYAMDRKR